MRKRFFTPLLAAFFCFLAADAWAKIIINPPPEVPSALGKRDFSDLASARTILWAQFNTTQGKIDEQSANCSSVEEGSPKVNECMAAASLVKMAVKQYRAAIKQFSTNIHRAQDTYKIITEMQMLAKRLQWSPHKQAQLADALNAFGSDGDNQATLLQVRQAWQAILARDKNSDFAREALRGEGPAFPGAGAQTQYNDCAIFALANATKVPYGVVAARATKLIGEGEWNSAADRTNPQETIETRGLKGGEVVMLAESFGQARVVPSTDFAKTLKDGHPVLVGVSLVDDDGKEQEHEVVLTKSFQHDGKTWYEMMDSNQGPLRRLYLSKAELDTVLDENGVVFQPERNTTIRLLR